MAMTYILQKLEELSQKLAVLKCNHDDLYSEFLQYQNDIEDIPRLKERIEQAIQKVQNQTVIKATDEEQIKEYMSLFNVLKDYLSEEKAKNITDAIVNFSGKDTLILIDGASYNTFKTKLCNELKNLGYNAKELQEYAKAEREERYDNFAGIIISLNAMIY